MKRGALIGGVLIVGVAGVALWRVRAASSDRPAPEQAASSQEPVAPEAARPPERHRPDETPAADPQAGTLDEARLMARLRSMAQSDPAQAITLARDGNRRWPASADAPERTSILIHALAATGQPMQARGEAERMVNQAPDSPWVREIERFTGAHRHRNVHVNDAGQIEYSDAPNK